jgi:hypothetical protein
VTTPKLPAQRSVLPGSDGLGCYSPPLGGEGKRPRRYIMRRLNLPIAVLAALIISLAGLVAAAPALAYNVSAVYRDCENNGQLTGQYSAGELRAALNQLPAQVAEYSACADVIRQALLRASSHSGGHTPNSKGPIAGAANGGPNNRGGGSGKAHRQGAKGSPAASKRGPAASRGAANAVTLANSNIRPGSTGTGGSTDSLPAPLLVVLVLLALTAVSGGAVAIRRRVVARHGT